MCNETIQILELFGGIGSPRCALRNYRYLTERECWRLMGYTAGRLIEGRTVRFVPLSERTGKDRSGFCSDRVIVRPRIPADGALHG